MTTRIRRAITIGSIVVVALCATFLGTALGGNDSTTQTCPDGQTLSWVKVGGDTFKQGKPLPEGASITDSVSGQGLDYTVRSTKDSAKLQVHGKGAATFEVACR